MKIVAMILILHSFWPPIIGQTEWVNEGATWHYDFQSYWIGYGRSQMTYEGDTIIDNVDCKALSFKTVYYNPLQMDTFHVHEMNRYIYQSGDTIWRYKSGEFFPLYNMSLSKGDTIDFMDFSLKENVNILLDVDTITYNNQKLRKQTIGIYAGPMLFTKMVVVEKFGVISNPFFFFWDEFYLGLSDQNENRLICYSDSDFELVNLSNFPCDFIYYPNSSLDERNEDIISIYPNPIRNNCYIHTERIVRNLFIQDILGRTVYSCSPLSNEFQLELGSLAEGIYFIEMTDSQNKIISCQLHKTSN